mgnify:CR=1 FL=1
MSTQVVPLASRRTLNGRMGKAFLEGNVFLAWADQVEARVVIDRADIVSSGKLGTGYKALGWNGSGTISGFKVTSKFMALVADYTRTGVMPPPVRLTYELADPEAFRDGRDGEEGTAMVERVTLLECKFWEAAMGFATESVQRQEIPFTFEGVSLDSLISNPQMPGF